VATWQSTPDPGLLATALGSMAHRGPDGQFACEFGHAGLGMRRLDILDVVGGVQPFFSEDGTIATVFNGEIYNAAQLRQQLSSRGHSFVSSHADGEVIPHLYEEFGVAFPQLLEGMFAIAVWDDKRQELLLTRDPFGIKPLFVKNSDGQVQFASELRALNLMSRGRKSMNFAAADAYFELGRVPSPDTIFDGIWQPEPATVTVFTSDSSKAVNYRTPKTWSWHGSTIHEASEAIEHALLKSISQQTIADVPLGVFLSGGIDSSLVAAIASRVTPLRSYTLTFPDVASPGKSLDAALAAQVAEMFGLDHQEVPLTAEIFLQGLGQVVDAMEQPFAGAISTFFLSAGATQHSRVCLTGDGADELFGSYWFHRVAGMLDFYGADLKASDGLRGIDRHALPLWGLDADDLHLIETAGSVRDLHSTAAARHSPKPHRILSEDFLDRLNESRSIPTSMHEGIWTRHALRNGSSNLALALALERESLLVDEVLPFSDRLSMVHSLEIRPAYLTMELAEMASAMPTEWLIGPGRVKSVLRIVAERWLPVSVTSRPKEGFVQPLPAWLAGPLKAFAGEVLSPDRTSQHGFWRLEAIAHLLEALDKRPNSTYKRVWNLVMFQLWWERNLA
jgi:asparagine synthase (glutamine-hydrolysing)